MRAPTHGERAAEAVARWIGSWTFVLAQTAVIALWIAANVWLLRTRPWDPYPFILLNLTLSLQAAYTGPILLVASNRQEQIDRARLAQMLRLSESQAEMVAAIREVVREIDRTTRETDEELARLGRLIVSRGGGEAPDEAPRLLE